jgi:hypothetical protein
MSSPLGRKYHLRRPYLANLEKFGRGKGVISTHACDRLASCMYQLYDSRNSEAWRQNRKGN